MNLHKSGKNTDPINLTIKERLKRSDKMLFVLKW
jgi:hypothetical protein